MAERDRAGDTIILMWRGILAVILSILVAAACAALLELARRERVVRAVPILVFHDVLAEGEVSPAAVWRSRDIFARDLVNISEAGHTTVTFNDLIAYARLAQWTLPENPIVITFDDGWSGQVRHALPLLIEHGLVATFFINSSTVGTNPHYVSWNDVRALQDAGMEIGGHGATHRELADDLSEAVLHKELVMDKERIEAELGAEIRTFSYPYNTHPESVISLLKAIGYRGARTAGDANAADPLFAVPGQVLMTR